MICIPIESADHKSDLLVIILEESSIERMRRADPFQVDCADFDKHLVNPRICICLEHDRNKLARFINSNDMRGLSEWLTRGFEYRPDLGDHDEGPRRIDQMN
jgi:hypothetical protein